MAKKSFVYYDTNYDPGGDGHTWSWIKPEISQEIADLLEAFDFVKLNAAELKEVMLAVVGREERIIIVQNEEIVIQEEDIVVIVFAQDVAPDTVLNDSTPTALVRQYLDNGGSIIWIGDIPFWYQATENGQNRNNGWSQNGAPANILGVNPVFPTQLSRAAITRVGKTLGLQSAWTGIRPVLIDKTIKVLAEAECPISWSYQPIPLSRLSRLWNRLSGISVGAGTIRVDVKWEANAQPEKMLLQKRLANGWFKNFDTDNEYSGFFQIWDYIPAVLSNEQLEDLCNLANAAGGN
jgi:hypothetical protein